ncbi:MAG: hypothetical protein NZ770_01400 [Candidatus Poseidoniaceae archaeon]|nr:hypothetical protein [Candidatus Poseidoniaceae archaeon]
MVADIVLKESPSEMGMELSGAWYALFVSVSFLGISTWYLRNFSEKVNLMRFCAILGSICMLGLVIWTWNLD